MSRKRLLSLAAAGVMLATLAEPAFADRGRDRGHHRGDDRGRHHDRDWDRDRNHNRDWNRHDRHDHRDRDWNLSFSFGVPYYDSYRYRAPVYHNAWGLHPHACRTDIEFDYWYGRPADIRIRRCADAYGYVYIVHDARRLWRYR